MTSDDKKNNGGKLLLVLVAFLVVVGVVLFFLFRDKDKGNGGQTTEATSVSGTEASATGKTETLTESETGKTTEAETGKSTEAETGKSTEAETGKSTEAKTETPTEAKTEKPTEAKTEKQTEKTSEANQGSQGKAYKFRNKKLLEQHYEKHGIEMGFPDTASYVAAANDVILDPSSLYKVEKEDGDDVYYRERDNAFVVVSRDGYIRTFFYPSGGKKYFDRQ